ncbi:ATP-binding cassette domain-containing protein [Arthrobacter sp. LAPM80]|uniref:ATP-binding cassette domain-containing protein n=1 Tax=Arthrobacter sp. LAPM80 TaxID=3141788 RepID=UPI00398A5309
MLGIFAALLGKSGSGKSTLLSILSALGNVMPHREFAGVSHAERRARPAELLNQVGLTDDMHGRKSNRLSGGKQQRLAIAWALATRPR